MKSFFHNPLIACLKHLCLFVTAIAQLNAAPVFENREDLLKHIETKRNFSFDIDQDQNQFPDPWFMENGQEFQTYHSLRIDADGHGDSSSLKIVFSGGKTGIYSAPIKLDPRFAYNLQLSYKGASLGERYSNRLTFGIRAYDKNNQLLKDLPRLVEKEFSSDWTRSRILRIEQLPENTTTCSLYLHLEGRPSGRSELWLDQIDIIPSPRIHFETKKPLNVYNFDDAMNYEVMIDGTNPDEAYVLDLNITDFMGNSIDQSSFPFKGGLDTKVINRLLGQTSSGVFNLNAKLKHNQQMLVEIKEIMARNTPVNEQIFNQAFGVILGHPKAPFDPLIQSLQLLGTQISKLSLLPEDFKISSSLSSEASLPELNPLLLVKAPDAGYQFIASLDHIPSDTILDKYNPPKNVLETFSTHSENWVKTINRMIFHYGNVLSDWQIGSDRDIIQLNELDKAKTVIDQMQKNTDWMKILIPSNQPFQKPGLVNNLYIPKNYTLSDIAQFLKKNQWNNLIATLELHSNEDQSQLFVIEDMVKKISFLLAQTNNSGGPIIERLFIDRLTDDRGAGLMNEHYEPHSTYFAAKTMINWSYGAKFLGSFQHPDKSIQNYVFRRGSKAFAIFWKDSDNMMADPAKFHLGNGIEWMDLMGNKSEVAKDADGAVLLPLGKTPIFLISPNPELWETMLSFKLTQSPLKAKVELQNQVATIENHFNQEANFEVEIQYPQGWTLESGKFETQLMPKNKTAFNLSLSPSAQSPINSPIPVYTHIDVSFKDNQHHVVAYREEFLLSDVNMNLSFFQEGKNLEMVIFVGLGAEAPAATSFIASALMPNGETFEAFFRNVQPGQNNSKRIFILNGKSMVGKNVNLSVRENIGQRYLNANFPIDPTF